MMSLPDSVFLSKQSPLELEYLVKQEIASGKKCPRNDIYKTDR
jgi:hypothetical protein